MKRDVDTMLHYGLDIANRTIYLGGEEVESDNTGTFIKSIAFLDSTAPQGDKPLYIILNSPGGDWYHGMAIYDAIACARNHVTICCFGYAMSAGAVILQAADERIMAPRARMMVHYGTDGMGITDNHRNPKAWADESDHTKKVMEKLLLDRINEKHPNFKREDVERMLEKDTFLSAKEAVRFGLADRVLNDE